jgi:hypothetical protein
VSISLRAILAAAAGGARRATNSGYRGTPDPGFAGVYDPHEGLGDILVGGRGHLSMTSGQAVTAARRCYARPTISAYPR